jgi:hypothetical protein
LSALEACSSSFTYEIWESIDNDASPEKIRTSPVQPEKVETEYRVYPEDPTREMTMWFWIRVKEAEVSMGPYVLRLRCGDNTISTIVQSDFEHHQNVEMYTDKNPVFFFLQYGNQAGCTNSYSVVGFKEVVRSENYQDSNRTWVARVQDEFMTKKMTHTFEIIVTAGASSITTGPFTLTVYCGLNSVRIIESIFERTQHVQAG